MKLLIIPYHFMDNKVYLGDNLSILKSFPNNLFDLIFIDPPYNKKKTRIGKKIKTEKNDKGLLGFGGEKYSRTVESISGTYKDTFEDYIGFMKPRIEQAHRLLKNTGSFYLIADYSEIHYLKILCDQIFGREYYRGSIYWIWDYGAKSLSNFPNKTNEILYYTKSNNFTWNYLSLPTIPYMSKGKLVSEEKLKRGKRITNWWFCSITGTNSIERKLYSYPTMKPKKILKNIITVSSNEGDLCLDFFAGSGSFGESCLELNRKFYLIDNNTEAYNIMKKRFNSSAEFINNDI